jgi:hypothetical protein
MGAKSKFAADGCDINSLDEPGTKTRAGHSVCLYFGVVISQMLLFSAITGIQRSTSDDVAFVVLFFENLISIGLLFYRLRNQSNVG